MSLTIKQKKARKKGIGASESIILFPEIPNPYYTPYELWMIKTGRIEKDQPLNDYQWWGHELEPVIAKRYEYERNEKLKDHRKTIVHPEIPYMLCHPDRFVAGKRKLVEIKNSSYDPNRWGEPGTDHVPPEYVIQVQHQLACTGYEEADLIVFFMNYRRSRIYHFKRDEQLISTIENKITSFWNNNVLSDIAPDLTTLVDCKLKFKNKNMEFAEANDGIYNTLSHLKIIRSAIKDEQIHEEELLKEIFEFIGEKTGIKKDDNILATWRGDKNGRRTFRLCGE